MADRSVSIRLRADIAGFESGMRKATTDTQSLARQMTQTGGAADAMRRRLEAATKALPKIKVDADSGPAEIKFAELRRELENLSSKRIGVDIDGASALWQMQQIERELQELSAMEADPLVRADVGMALQQLRQVEVELERLDGRKAKVDVDTSAALAGLAMLGDTAGGLGEKFSGAFDVIGKAGPANVAVAIGAIQALPAVATAAASGIVFALGGALTAVGVTAASQSDKVRLAWSDAVGAIKKELADAAEPFEDSMVRAADVAGRTFDRLKPTLARIFRDLVPDVDAFIASLGDGVASLGPHLERLSGSFGEMLRALGDQMPQIMGNLGEMFDTFSAILDEDPQMLANLLEDATELMSVGAEVLSWADEIKAALMLPVNPKAGSDLAFEYMFGVKPDEFYQNMQGAPPMFAAVDQAMAAAAAASKSLGDGATTAEGGIRNLSQAMEEFFDPAAKALDAEIRLKQAIEDANRAAKEQKLSEVERLQGVRDVTMAISEAAKVEMERTGKTTEATRAFQDNIGRLTEWAGKNGAARETIAALAESLGVTIAKTKDGTVAIDKFGNAVKILPNGKKVEIDANTAKGKAELAAFLLHVARQKGTVDVHVRTIYDSPSGKKAVEQKNRAMGGIERYAAGGVRASAGGRMSPPPHITSEPRILYGEGSGDEAFIPYDPRYRPRAIEILGTIAQDFGLALYNENAQQQVRTLSTGVDLANSSISANLAGATRELDVTLGGAGSLTQAVAEVGSVGVDMSQAWTAGSDVMSGAVSGLADVVGISTDQIVVSVDYLADAAAAVADAISSAGAVVGGTASSSKRKSVGSTKKPGLGSAGSVIPPKPNVKKPAAKTIDENSIAGHYGGSFIRGDSGLSNTARVSAPTTGGYSSAGAAGGAGAGGAGMGEVVRQLATVVDRIDRMEKRTPVVVENMQVREQADIAVVSERLSFRLNARG